MLPMMELEEGPCRYLALPIDCGDVTMAVSELPSAHPIVAVEAGSETEKRLEPCWAFAAVED
jgi:hypothetical protein